MFRFYVTKNSCARFRNVCIEFYVYIEELHIRVETGYRRGISSRSIIAPASATDILYKLFVVLQYFLLSALSVAFCQSFIAIFVILYW